MRTIVASLALALLVPGCLSPATPADLAPASLQGALRYQQDCTIRTADWPDLCTARASHTVGPKEEIWVAVDPGDPGHAAIGAKDLNPDSSARCVWNGLSVTFDGGHSWEDVVIGGRYDDRAVDNPFFGYACNTDPDLDFAQDGTLYYLVELYNILGKDSSGPIGPGPNQGDLGYKFVLARSDDGGRTWPTLTTLPDFGPGIAAVIDYSRMRVSPTSGTVVAAWDQFDDAGTYSIVHAVAVRGQGTAPDPPQVLFAIPAAGLPSGDIADVEAAPDGTWVMGMLTSEGDDLVLWTVRSTDDARSWDAPVRGFSFPSNPLYLNHTQFRAGSGLELTFGPDGTLYAGYDQNDQGDPNVWVRRSDDLGRTWQDGVQVSGDGSGHAQFHQNIVASADGVLHMLFFDRRWDPGDRLLDVTYAESLDGGATWSEQRVTSLSFDGDLGVHQAGFPFIGDYLGIAASQGTVWLGFPDTILGHSVVAAAKFVDPSQQAAGAASADRGPGAPPGRAGPPSSS